MKILDSLSEEHALKLNENLVDWLTLEPGFVKFTIYQAINYKDYPIKIIECECKNLVLCNLNIFHQGLEYNKDIDLCSCLQYSNYLINNVCNQDSFDRQISTILKLEKKEHNSDNFRKEIFGIIPPAFGLYPVVNFNLDMLFWSIYANPISYIKKENINQIYIKSFYDMRFVIRNLILKCKQNNSHELDKLLQWWGENHHQVIHKRLNTARISLESSKFNHENSLFSKEENYIKSILEAYRSYYEIQQFLETLFNLIKISEGKIFSDNPFKGEKTVLNGMKMNCKDIASYCAKLKECGIPEINAVIDAAYNNQLRNKTAHNDYEIKRENIVLLKTGEEISFESIDIYLTSLINFQRTILIELGVTSFFDFKENSLTVKNKVNEILENQEPIKVIPSYDMYKYNLPTYGILSMRFENEDIPTIEINQFWSHAFLDSNMESFQTFKIIDKKFIEIPNVSNPIWISFTFVPLLPGEFVTGLTPILQEFKEKSKDYKKIKLRRYIVAPNHPFFLAMGIPIELGSIKMVGLGIQEKIIEIN